MEILLHPPRDTVSIHECELQLNTLTPTDRFPMGLWGCFGKHGTGATTSKQQATPCPQKQNKL